jgi:REP element-mobilizing transposase RayT
MNGKNVGAKNFSPLRLPNANKFQSPSKSIGSFVRGFKIGVTEWFRKNTDIYSVWQRNYFEHVIRDEKDLNRIRNYIITAQAVPFGNNPLKWAEDEYYL